jgi:hypothetical protein
MIFDIWKNINCIQKASPTNTTPYQETNKKTKHSKQKNKSPLTIGISSDASRRSMKPLKSEQETLLPT